jgi:hypothetical protein
LRNYLTISFRFAFYVAVSVRVPAMASPEEFVLGFVSSGVIID